MSTEHDKGSWKWRIEDRVNQIEGFNGRVQDRLCALEGNRDQRSRDFALLLEERNDALGKLEVRDGKIVGLEEGLAAMTAERDEARTISERMSESHYRMSQERDDQYLRNTQLEWTKNDLIARNNSLMDTLKAERKARQEWDAANTPAPSPPDTGGEPFNPEGWTVEHTPTDICPPTEEEIEDYLARHQKAYPGMWEFAGMDDERKALYGEMARWLGKLSKEPGLLHFKSNIDDLLELVSRAEKAMEGESHDK